MERALKELRRRRVWMLLANLAYFLALLAVGAAVFLGNGAGGGLLAAVCVAGYLLLVRPMRQRYVAGVRREILCRTVCAPLTDVCYAPKEGVEAETVREVFPMADDGAFMSREHITGRTGSLRAEAADVTFPIREEGRRAMFSGALVRLTWPGSEFPPLSVDAGGLQGLSLPRGQRELLEKLNEFIPGSLYLRAKGETLTLLLRGRFLALRVNPLMQLSERTLGSNPFPELEQAVHLAKLMAVRP